MPIPSKEQMTGSNVSESQFKSGMDNIVDYLKDAEQESLVLDTEAHLKLFKSEIGRRAKTLDSGKVWEWNGTAWNDTGLSDLDLAKLDSSDKSNNAILVSKKYTDLKKIFDFFSSFENELSLSYINNEMYSLFSLDKNGDLLNKVSNIKFDFFRDFNDLSYFNFISSGGYKLDENTGNENNESTNIKDQFYINTGEDDFYIDKDTVKYKRNLHPYFNKIHYDWSSQNSTVFKTVQSLYDFYDDLILRNSEYLSKEKIGTDITGLPIYAYTLKPKKYYTVGFTEDETKHPKFVLTSGVHGNERTGQINALLFFSRLTEQYKSDEILSVLRHCIEFVIIPAVNPWGVENAKRENSLNVDVNRDFNDDEGFTQLESTTMRDYINTLENVAYIVDLHGGGTQEYFLWTGGVNNKSLQIMRNSHAKMLSFIYSNVNESDEIEYSFRFSKSACKTIVQYYSEKGYSTNLLESPIRNPILGSPFNTRVTIVKCISILINEAYESFKFISLKEEV